MLPAFLFGMAGVARAGDGGVILYTAGTGGHLEALARDGDVLGGLPRRATLLGEERASTPLIVEAGGLFEPGFRHEAARARLIVESLAAMGYDVVHLSAGDLALGAEAIVRIFDELPVTLVASNVRPRGVQGWPALPSFRRRAGESNVLIVGVVPPDEVPPEYVATDPAAAVRGALAEAAGDAPESAVEPRRLVVLSDLSPAANRALAGEVPEIALIISTRASVPTELGGTRVLPRTDAGMTVGQAYIDRRDMSGEPLSVSSRLAEDARIRDRLTLYYRAVAAASPEPLALDPDADGDVRYVGARICARCHEEVFRGWLDTPHADAYDTLVDLRRHELTECIQCHATGAGHWSGFTSDLGRPHFAGVQCESCHGPGSVHSRLPAATTIRREVPDRVCIACHTESTSHGFHASPASYREQVIHRPAPAGAAEAPSPAERARIELYLMSFCPYGGETARELAALRRSLGETAVEVEIRYIVRKTGDAPRSAGDRAVRRQAALGQAGEACVDDGGEPGAGGNELAAGFSSLHGPEEVIENLRQIVIARRYPDRSLDYIARRAALPDEDWRVVAAELGMEPDVIESGLPAARTRLAEDAERARALGIVASPTLRLNGVPVVEARGGAALARAVCSALTSAPRGCGSLPACESDSDCRAAGMEGRCMEPGQPGARCVFSPAPPVTLHVFNDPGCGLCSPIEIVAGAKELFPSLELVAHDVTAGEGGDWIEAFGIDSVPAFVFAGVESSSVFPRIEQLLEPEVEHGDLEGRRLGSRFHRGPLYFQREERPGRVDLFVDATGELSRNFFELLAELYASPEADSILARADLHLHHVLETRLARDGAASPPRLVQRGDEAYLVPAGALPELASRLGDDDLAEARRQACLEMAGGEKVIDYLLDRAANGEVESGDWRGRVERLGLDPSRIGFCAGSGEADPRLDADRRLAGELGIRVPALLVANRFRLDGLGPWNQGAFIRALAEHLPASDHSSAPLGAAVEEEAP